jgi:CRP/FNR family cyclic AMP-dependent transcriptional regulator
MNSLEPILKSHAFFKDLAPELFEVIVGCASNAVFKAGEVILDEEEPADKFYLIRSGKVSIYIAHPKTVGLQTLREGEILGWSWLVPPYEYRFSARADEPTQAVVLDGRCLRAKCEENPAFGYELMKRLAVVLTKRLEAARLQILDLVG